MVAPLPPVVHGPITTSSPAVRVTAIAPNAAVELLVGGSAIGDAVTIGGGELWVPVSSGLSVGDSVHARQTTSGGAADSTKSVIVVDVPNPLPAPVFVSPLSSCMSQLALDGLVPGATVVVTQGGSTLAKVGVAQPSQWIGIDPSGSLTGGMALEARQEVGSTSSPSVLSLPIVEVNREVNLPAPGLAQPIMACRTSIDFFGMFPSADVSIENEGQTATWFNVAPAFNGWGAPPLQQGKLVARQAFQRCGQPSPETVVTVGPPAAPAVPEIQAGPCPDVARVVVTKLEPGAVVELSTVVPHPTIPGAVVIAAFGEATASKSSESFDLPPSVSPTTASGDPVRLSAQQILCGLRSNRSDYTAFATPGGPFPAPKITEPVVECARSIPVTGAHASSMLQIIYSDTNEPLSDATMATAAEQVIRTWFPLQQGRDVAVVQSGCNANGTSPAINVRALPSPLAAPQIVEPVRPSAPTVAVRGCTPGARLHLLVDGVVRNSIDTLTDDALVPVGPPVLQERQSLLVVQTLCAESSPIEGKSTLVTKGRMKVTVTPSTVERGTTVNVTVSASDADTGAPINGAQVFIDGKLVGQTGVAFQFKPVLGQPNPAGVVKEPVAHIDQSFTITLKDPPPRPKGRLFLNIAPTQPIPNTLRLVSATWTVATQWAPVQTFTTTGANTSVTLPDAPANAPDKRVSVRLATTWELAGTINGYVFPYQQFPGFLNPDPTFFAWANKDLTAGWLVLWELITDTEGLALVRVVVNYQGAT